MTKCNDTKAQIDDFSNISQQQRQNIYAHIATCEQCAEYKEIADSTAELLGSLGSALKQIPINERTYEKLQKRSKKDRRTTLTALAGMTISLFACLWLYGQGSLQLEGGIILLGWAIGSGIVAWWSSRKAIRFSSIPHDLSNEFLLDWRKELNREIKITTVVASVLSVEIVFVLFRLFMDNFSSQGAIISLGVNAVLAIGVIYAFIIALPALKNELMLIEEDA